MKSDNDLISASQEKTKHCEWEGALFFYCFYCFFCFRRLWAQDNVVHMSLQESRERLYSAP